MLAPLLAAISVLGLTFRFESLAEAVTATGRVVVAVGGWLGVMAIGSRSGLVPPVSHGEPGIELSEPSTATSNPETLLEPWLATYRRLPSGVTASALPLVPPVANG